MTISGFTYVRNGFDLAYPFIAAIQSILPIVDEMFVVVGDSTDGTREAVEDLKSSKIKIIDSIWDMEMRKGGKIYAQQANIGLDQIKSSNWAIHIQADEVIHEKDVEKIKNEIILHDKNLNVEGFILPFYHFFGDYKHIRSTRKTHRFEIRVFRNTGTIRSYRDSQGFRKYKDMNSYNSGEKGKKLNVIKIDAPVYHYSFARNPKLMSKKASTFLQFYFPKDAAELKKIKKEFDFNEVDKLIEFHGEHPKYMAETIAKKNWDFEYDPSRSNMIFKDKILNKFADLTGIHLFEYKNYKLLNSK